MPRKILRRLLPNRETLQRYPLLRRFAPLLMHPRLWALKRSLVAGGLGIGLFCAMIPGPVQLLCALMLAALCRVNVPAAVLGTFASNPFTIVPLYFAAYRLGSWVMGGGGRATLPALPHTAWSHPQDLLQAWIGWLSALGVPLAIGIAMLACMMAFAGYVAVQLGWRTYVMHTWRARHTRRKAHRPI